MIKWLEKNRKISLILTILIAIEIFYFSSIPGTAGVGIGGNDWIPRMYHFSVFFLFSFFFFITIKGNKKIKPIHLVIVLIVSITHAILDEFHQTYVPFRYPSISDVLTNSLGIFFSTATYLYANKIKQKTQDIRHKA